MKEWRIREGQIPAKSRALAEKLSISHTLLEILWRRGFREFTSLENFLAPRLERLSPLKEWPQIPEMGASLASELLAGKKLAIWGDYDVDGITATALALDVLEAHGLSASWYLPDRLNDGYGLNLPGIEKLASEGCQLLLTVDCGIADHAPIARARELGMSVYVSDHHLPQADLPLANALCDPRLGAAGSWPCSNLAGVGVAFYLMAAVNANLSRHTGKRYRMDDALDLVALGTLADIMPLEGENRTLVSAGLKAIASAKRPGIAALKFASGFDASAKLNSVQAVFRLAPRINAAGRMGDANLALRLLREKDYSKAADLAVELEQRNSARKNEEERIHREAMAQAEEILAKDSCAALVLAGEGWHPGIVGIVASRMVDKFQRPSIILLRDGECLRGSGRTARDFDLHGALCKCSDLLLRFGGHSQAAGLALAGDQLEPFRKRFSAIAAEAQAQSNYKDELLLDGCLDFRKASEHIFLRELELMQPFGAANPEPLFLSPPLLLKGRSALGHSGEHVILKLEDQSTGITLNAKAWRMAKEFPPSMLGKAIKIVYSPRIDEYNGIASVDLGLKDWRPTGSIL